MKLLILIFLSVNLFFNFSAFSQTNENDQHLIRKRVYSLGALNIQLQKKGFSYKNLSDLANGSTLIGMNSYGISLSKSHDTKLIPFSFDVFVDANAMRRTYQYDVSAFGSGFAEQVSDLYAHEVKVEMLNFDRKRFRENHSPLIVDRFKIVDLKYLGMINVVPNIVKLTFSGKLTAIQSTRYTITPEDIQELISQKTGDPNAGLLSVPRNATALKQIMGSGLVFHNDFQANVQAKKGFSLNTVKSFGELFLGDSEFSLGLMLFNFLDTKISYAIDGVQGSSNNDSGYEFDFISYKTTYSADLKFERIVSAKSFARNFILFAEVTNEKSYLSVGNVAELNRLGKDYETDKTFFYNTTVSAGLKMTFLKSYKKDNLNHTILKD